MAQAIDSLNTNPEPDILIVHTPGLLRANKLSKKEQLRIELEGEDQPIIGRYTFLNDSILLVDNQEVKLKEI